MGWEDAAGQPANAGGKRVRPALCLYAAGLCGAPEAAMPGAVAVELVHNFSLVHDEVQDLDAERHGRPTLWALHGPAQAINAGDYLYARAQHALLGGVGPAERRLLALRILTSATERMIAGQWADVAFESRQDVTVDEYLAMIAGKTGALLGAPLEVGAVLAGAPATLCQALGRWGEAIGLAFQAHDDYLGTWGNPNLTGKSNTNDIARRKKTLPVIHGLAGPAGARIRAMYAQPELDSPTVAEVVRLLEESSAGAFTRTITERMAAEAAAILDGMDLPGAAKAELRTVGDYLVNRDG
jgi:geranylgeranyl diphosphate synthase type I